jgi:hypothetical protein
MNPLHECYGFRKILDYSWDETGPSFFWGFVGKNYHLVKEHIRLGLKWYFTDMPYWGRWNGLKEAVNPNMDFYWRIVPNATHVTWVNDYPDDRFKQLGVEVHDWKTRGDHILVCPSSPTMERFIGRPGWTEQTVATLKRYTDRPIKIRHKPRARGTSGPAAARVPFAEDARNAHAVVTSVSMSAVEAACLGIPVFTHEQGPASPIALWDLSKIETPIRPDRTKWLNTLSYYQFTEKEIRQGIHNINDSFVFT